jgi:hypothetical protein
MFSALHRDNHGNFGVDFFINIYQLSINHIPENKLLLKNINKIF